MKTALLFSFTIISSITAHAASDFCAPQAAAAAQALANINGTLSEKALEPMSLNGRSFIVTLTEGGVQNYYSVITTGGHDCLVKSVKVLGKPTLRD